MIFSCDRCGRRYSVPDERVQGRAFRANCKACGNTFVVRPGATAPALAAAAPAPAATPPRAAPPPPPAPPPAAAPPRDPFQTATTAPGDERSLTDTELAWLTGAHALPAADSSEAATAPAEDSPPEPRGPGVVRATLAAVILGLAAAGAVWLLWPHRAPPPPPPPVAVAAPPPAPPPTPAPPPPPPPEPAATPSEPAVAEPAPSPPSPEPARARTPAARFEPGAVTVAPSRRKPAHAISRKDRKLLDLLARKADEAPPPEPVEKLDLDTGRSLDPAAVVRVVADGKGAFSGCITRSARPGQAPEARRATLLLTVSASGAVSAAGLAEAEVQRTLLGKCIVTAARRLVFPAFEGEPVDVSVPLVLEAR